MRERLDAPGRSDYDPDTCDRQACEAASKPGNTLTTDMMNLDLPDPIENALGHTWTLCDACYDDLMRPLLRGRPFTINQEDPRKRGRANHA